MNKNLLFILFWGPTPASLYQYVNERASRIQSESSVSGFVEALPFMERISMSDFVFRRCKDRANIWNRFYKKWHVPFIVQTLAAIVQLFVQVLAF